MGALGVKVRTSLVCRPLKTNNFSDTSINWASIKCDTHPPTAIHTRTRAGRHPFDPRQELWEELIKYFSPPPPFCCCLKFGYGALRHPLIHCQINGRILLSLLIDAEFFERNEHNDGDGPRETRNQEECFTLAV